MQHIWLVESSILCLSRQMGRHPVNNSDHSFKTQIVHMFLYKIWGLQNRPNLYSIYSGYNTLPINMVQVSSPVACIAGDTAKVCICKMWHYYIWWHQSVAVTIKPVLESIWVVQPHKINILIKFSFIYYFFNREKLKMNDCKRRQFYHPLCTWVHVIRCMEFYKPKLMFTLF